MGRNREAELGLALDSDVAECAGIVTGTVQWSGLSKAPRQVLVELLYRTEGTAGSGHKVIDLVALPGEVEGSHGFRLRVPVEGPISYEGELIQILWEVQVRVDLAMATDKRVSAPIAVLPFGGIVLWRRNADPSQLQPPPPINQIQDS